MSFKTSTSAGLNQTISQPTYYDQPGVRRESGGLRTSDYFHCDGCSIRWHTRRNCDFQTRRQFAGNRTANWRSGQLHDQHASGWQFVDHGNLQRKYYLCPKLFVRTGTDHQAATLARSVPAPLITAVLGQSLTFTASVLSVAPGDGIPTGTVTFRDGSKVLGTAALINGQATFTTTSLSIGWHAHRVVYSGSTNFKTSTSSDLPVTVTASLAAKNDEAI